jgi:hypothetical protein
MVSSRQLSSFFIRVLEEAPCIVVLVGWGKVLSNNNCYGEAEEAGTATLKQVKKCSIPSVH